MTELFTLVNRSVAGQTVQTVNARELRVFGQQNLLSMAQQLGVIKKYLKAACNPKCRLLFCAHQFNHAVKLVFLPPFLGGFSFVDKIFFILIHKYNKNKV
ncbi:hypothetical protein [Kingella negevensis]|uniref:hypothetical protein n=1 Tax=Kingella negevensis TaxID=1522312 RepID=UPI00050A2016|nr:hypothetical protein [Kingella negevensis]MDK4688532.1 hypothetical protein [Kingella negevensis]